MECNPGEGVQVDRQTTLAETLSPQERGEGVERPPQSFRNSPAL
jgi:hypothetical protein